MLPGVTTWIMSDDIWTSLNWLYKLSLSAESSPCACDETDAVRKQTAMDSNSLPTRFMIAPCRMKAKGGV
jgi:hypothetical protein